MTFDLCYPPKKGALRGFRGRVRTGKENSRSLHCAPPDFLLRVVALRKSMRLSPGRAACLVVASGA